MKIAIIGAGALGIMFGTMLSKENDVTLFDVYEPLVNELNEKGIECVDGDDRHKAFVKVKLSGLCEEQFDLVMLLVKTNYTDSSLTMNSGIIGPDTYVLTLQNGLGNKEKILPYVDENHLLIGVTKTNAFKLSMNESKRANHAPTTLGYNSSNYEFVIKLKQTFENCGFDILLNDDIDTLVWNKVFLNVATNAYCAYYNVHIADLFNNDEYWLYCATAITESVNVANALGKNFDATREMHSIFSLLHEVKGYPSMWQDIQAKRKTEIDSLNGRISSLGKKLNIPTPENDRITKCIKELESSFVSK